MKNTDGKLQNAQQIFATPGPAATQQSVVLLLDPYARKAPQNIERISEVLELDKVDLPRPGLPLADRFQCHGSVAMPTPRVVEENVNPSGGRHDGSVTQDLCPAEEHETCYVDNSGSHLSSMASRSTFMQFFPPLYGLFISWV